MAPVTYITRTETFSAAHRLNATHLTQEQNKELYGKCNHPHFHGHNYKGTTAVNVQFLFLLSY